MIFSLPKNRINIENKEVANRLNCQKINDYFWFLKSFSYFELENLNPTNIQKFIKRSKRNITVPLDDQLKICCMVKQLEELPVTLMGISLVIKNFIW